MMAAFSSFITQLPMMLILFEIRELDKKVRFQQILRHCLLFPFRFVSFLLFSSFFVLFFAFLRLLLLLLLPLLLLLLLISLLVLLYLSFGCSFMSFVCYCVNYYFGSISLSMTRLFSPFRRENRSLVPTLNSPRVACQFLC